MSGLCDSTTGLKEGTGLQFQTKIGTAGLDISLGSSLPTSFLLLEDGSSIFLLEDGTSQLGLEN